MNHNKPCRFFQQGNCRYGNNCQFQHSSPMTNMRAGGGFGSNNTGGNLGGGFRGTGNNNTSIGNAFGGGGGRNNTNVPEKKAGKSPDDLVKELLTSSWLKFGVTPIGGVYKWNQIPKGMRSMALPNNDTEGYVFPGIPYSRDELYVEAAKKDNPTVYVGEAIQKVEDCRMQWLTAYHNQTNQFFNPSQLTSGLSIYQESLPVHANASRWQTEEKLFESQANVETANQTSFNSLSNFASPHQESSSVMPTTKDATGTNNSINPGNNMIDTSSYIQLGRDQTLTRLIEANVKNYSVTDFTLHGIPLEPPPIDMR